MIDKAVSKREREGDNGPVSLEARNVWKWLVNDLSLAPAIRDITFRIPAGSWAVVTGPSGSGKTTLLLLLGALDRPSRGQILFDGRDLSGLSELALARIRRRIGFIFQDYALIEKLPIWENITYPLIPRGVGSDRRRQMAAEALASIGLSGYEEKLPEQLSGGERQRAAFARAIAGGPGLLIADEPTSNLDTESVSVLIELLSRLHVNGMTILLATHDPLLISQAGQRYELRKGALVEDATSL